uniref:phosphopyruvate hydratase n=1 Tax=Poecilia reticulata TaxID=8081 RepID=A0A3P9Q0A6_POERE
ITLDVAGESTGLTREMDIHKMRIAAAEFYRKNGVPAIIERALNELFLRQPADVHGYLVGGCFLLPAEGVIHPLRLNHPIINMSSAAVVSHFAPVGTGESQRSSDHVETALQWIHEPFRNLLLNQNPCDQFQGGKKPLTFHLFFFYISGKKSVVDEKQFPPAEPPEPVLLEGMAVGSVSLAVAKSGAKIKGMPLYKYISALKNQKEPAHFHVPVPWISLLSCGKKSPGKLCLLEEIILISKVGHPVKQVLICSTILCLFCPLPTAMTVGLCEYSKITLSSVSHNGVLTASCERPEQPLDLISNACTNLKVPLGVDVFLALNCAAPKLVDYSKGKYEVATGGLKSPDELIEVYHNLISKYPAVVAVIDPFRREVSSKHLKLSPLIITVCSFNCLLLSFLYFSLPGVHGYVFRHANETTVSDIIHKTDGRMENLCTSLKRSLLPQAVGLGLDYVKLGGLGGAETMAKYNRLIAIEEELAQQGLLGRCFSVTDICHSSQLSCFTSSPEQESGKSGQVSGKTKLNQESLTAWFNQQSGHCCIQRMQAYPLV